jgi:hypothetical protein
VGAAAQGAGFAITNSSRSCLLQTRMPAAMRAQGFAAAASLLYLADVTSIAIFGMLSGSIDVRILMLGATVMTCIVAGGLHSYNLH